MGIGVPVTAQRAAGTAEPAPCKMHYPSTYLTVRQEAGTLVRMTCSGVGAAPILPGTLQTPQ